MRTTSPIIHQLPDCPNTAGFDYHIYSAQLRSPKDIFQKTCTHKHSQKVLHDHRIRHTNDTHTRCWKRQLFLGPEIWLTGGNREDKYHGTLRTKPPGERLVNKGDTFESLPGNWAYNSRPKQEPGRKRNIFDDSQN